MGLLSGHSSSRSVQFCPSAYDHDDYQQAIERWNSTAWISTDGKTLYLSDDPRRATLPYADKYCSFHERWATAFTILSISLVLVVVLSAAISQASFREPHARNSQARARDACALVGVHALGSHVQLRHSRHRHRPDLPHN